VISKMRTVYREMRADINGPDGKIYYGWWNVLAAFPCIIFIFTTSLLMIKLIMPDAEEALGMSRVDTMWIGTIKFATSAVAAFVGGFLVDRLGVKSVLYLCSFVTGGGLIFGHFIDSVWMYRLAGVPLGFSSMPLLMATKTLVARWFNRRLGIALGVTMTASSLGGIILPMIFAQLIETYGWQDAMALSSIGIFLFVIPVIHFVIRDNPTEAEIASEFGEHAQPKSVGRGGLIEDSSQQEIGPTFSEIVRKPSFAVIGCLMVAIGFVDQGFTLNLTPFLVNDLGFTLTKVSFTITVSFIFGFSSKLFFGWLFDKTSFKGLSICYVVNALAILFALGIQGMVTLLIFQVARGFAHSGILLETPVLAKHAYGPFHLGKVIGTLSALAGVGLTLGPITIAKFFDIYGNYNMAFWLLGGIMALCAVVIYLVPPEYRLKMQREHAQPGHAAG